MTIRNVVPTLNAETFKGHTGVVVRKVSFSILFTMNVSMPTNVQWEVEKPENQFVEKHNARTRSAPMHVFALRDTNLIQWPRFVSNHLILIRAVVIHVIVLSDAVEAPKLVLAVNAPEATSMF